MVGKKERDYFVTKQCEILKCSRGGQCYALQTKLLFYVIKHVK
ncbi:hypothetical protein ME7_01085 [Bartonella birtlesii LL-WM9]|uniref:Uncharacterized protein n=1 Tax=Bartonella birtlesii LL-WM9 TaxID=1094552 RepID=J0PU67_9HYPH|nr:hypothetical protein ME7_01085 [Bartonella birtlesii LL-WM9]